MTPSERIALLDAAILAVRPHGFLSETVLLPLSTLRDDLPVDSPVPADKPAIEAAKAVLMDAAKPPVQAPVSPAPVPPPAKDAK